MIHLDDVSFAYPGSEASVLSGLSLDVQEGEFLAILGGNGSGKTSLCRVLTGLIPHFYHGRFAGTGSIAGASLPDTGVGELTRHVGYVYQDFENQLLRPRVRDDVAFAPLNYGLADHAARGMGALATLGLEHLADRIIWELSGGERHLVAIAGVLALGPRILCIDEPISQLDPVHARHVYDRLRDLNINQGTTILVVEHFTEFVGEYCSSAALLASGSIRWKTDAAEALGRVEELLEHDLAPPPATRVAFSLGIPAPLPITALACAGAIRTDFGCSPDPAESVVDEPLTPEPGHVVVSLRNFGHHYVTLHEEKHTVLSGVDLTFRAGERIALVGGNGSGKSTMLRLMAGLERPRSGLIEVPDRDGVATGAERPGAYAALVYQQPHEMFIEDSIRGDIGYYLSERRVPDRGAMVEQLLSEFDLTDLAERDGRLLSGGQMRRASLAIAAGMRPRLLLLDEPTATLDVVNRSLIVAMLDRLKRWVETTIVATHDMELVAAWAERAIVLGEGTVIADLPVRELFAQPGILHRARIREPQVVEICRLLAWTRPALSVEELVARIEPRVAVIRGGRT